MKKMKKMFEAVNSPTPEYAMELCDLIGRSGKLKGPWKVAQDEMSGTVYAWKSRDEFAVYATPWWEGSNAINAVTSDGSGMEVELETIPFKSTGDLKKDLKNWEDVMNKLLGKLDGRKR